MKVITEVKEVTDYKEVNEFIKNDWELYKIVPSQEKIIYILIKSTTRDLRR